MPTEPDIMTPLEQAIAEFHKLREISNSLQERAQWPEVKVPVPEESRSSADEAVIPEVPAR